MFGFGKNKQLREQVEQLQTQVETLRNETKTFSIADASSWNDFVHGGAGSSYRTAMSISAVFACVRLIAGAVASAPCRVYRRGPDEQRRNAYSHPLAELLRISPNEYTTAATFWRTLISNKVLNGNGYAYINRTRNGVVAGLHPLQASQVAPFQAWERGLDAKTGCSSFRLFYEVTLDDGRFTVVDQDDMLHVPNIGWDGRRGLSTITAGDRALGLAGSAEDSSAAFFKQGMQSNIAISYDKQMAPETIAQLKAHIEERLQGKSNFHKPLILTEGGKATQLSMNAADAQLIESRKFSVIDICRFFGVPPVMIGESEKSSSWGSGVEQMARWFTMFSMNDHFTAVEQELERKLFRADGHFAEFDESELTRGDTKTRHESYRIARGSMQEPGYMTPNEIRAAEGLPPVAGGDTLTGPQEQSGKKPAKEND